MIIDVPRIALLVDTDWLKRYSADFLFSKKRLVFKSRGQKLSIPIKYQQPIESFNYKSKEYKVNTAEWKYDDKGVKRI